MAVIEYDRFAGAFPGVDRTKLRPPQAVQAENVDLRRGVVEPLKGPATLTAGAFSTTPRSIYRYTNDLWFEFDAPTDVVQTLAGRDPWERVYYASESGGPRFTANDVATTGSGPYPAVDYPLGIPAPTTPPSATLTGTATDPTATAETRYYVFTYVDRYGHEGPPSPPSNSVDWRPGNGVDLTLPGPPTGNHAISVQRVYRANGTGTGAVWQHVADFGVAAGTYTDPEGPLGEVLPSEEWSPAPTDMAHLVAHPAGFLVGARGNEVLFSEPGVASAWPVRYRQVLQHQIVALAIVGTTIVALTDAQPVLLTGQHPAAIAVTYTNVPQGCLSREGVVETGHSVLYPSPDGLVSVTPSGASLITLGVHTRETWQALGPQNIRAFLWEGLYLAFIVDPVAGAQKGFVFNPAQPEAGVVTVSAVDVGAGMYSASEDRLYLAIGNDLAAWGEGSAYSIFYAGAPHLLAKPAPPGVMQVFYDGPPPAVGFAGDHQLVATEFISSQEPVRLYRLTDRYRYWGVQIFGQASVSSVVIASSMAELQRV